MASEAEIRSQLKAVADGQLDLWAFADWVDSYTWNMHRDSLPGAIRLAAKIHHRLADYDMHGDEAALRAALVSLLDRIEVIAKVIESKKYAPYVLSQTVSNRVLADPVILHRQEIVGRATTTAPSVWSLQAA